MVIYYSDYEAASVDRVQRNGRTVYLYELDARLCNVLGPDGEYLATVQCTDSGWRFYGPGVMSRRSWQTRREAFVACCKTAAVKWATVDEPSQG